VVCVWRRRRCTPLTSLRGEGRGGRGMTAGPPRWFPAAGALREPNWDKTGIPTRDRDPHCGDGTGIKPGTIAVWLAHSRAYGQPTVTLYRIIIPILTVTWCLRYSHDGRFGRLLLLRWLLLLLLLHVPMFVPHATATPHYSWLRKSSCRCSSVACTGWSSPSPAPVPSLSPTPSPPPSPPSGLTAPAAATATVSRLRGRRC